jgi:uncharacterized protein (TIGR02594 family)
MTTAKIRANEDFALRAQTRMKNLGFYDGALDGWAGRMTNAAFDRALPDASAAAETLPWVAEGLTVFGLHEVRDNARLRAWLRSDGKTLGDPAQLPWCGDYVETCIKNALPDESHPGALGINPYWARNWLLFGAQTEPCFGAVVVFSRGSGGHVGFAVGWDASDIYTLGGNQSDSVNVVRIARSRLLGWRWPRTFTGSKPALPLLTPGAIPRSANEV